MLVSPRTCVRLPHATRVGHRIGGCEARGGLGLGHDVLDPVSGQSDHGGRDWREGEGVPHAGHVRIEKTEYLYNIVIMSTRSSCDSRVGEVVCTC